MTRPVGLIDGYLFRECAKLFAALCGLVLAILLIERLIRVVDLVANAEDGGITSFRMIVDLIPHYLQLAMSAALFLGMIIAVDRLSRSGELVTMLAAGLSLRRLSRPFFLLAMLVALASIITTGFLQPIGRYDYRQTVNRIQNQSFKASFQEGRFVTVGDVTVWTEARDYAGRKLGETFILETRTDGSERFISAPSGEVLATGENAYALVLETGRGGVLAAPDARAGPGRQSLFFDRLVQRMQPGTADFRVRGKDERELMLPELADASAFPEVMQAAASAAFHDQLGRAVLILVLPLLALPLGMNIGRMPKAGGVILGVVILLVIQKALEYGLQAAASGAIPGWAGAWPVVALTGGLSAILFSRAAGESLFRLRRHVADRPHLLGPAAGRHAI